MATYVYLCPEHGEFEEEHSVENKLEFCPLCEKDNKKNSVTRLIGKTSFILQGSSWAKNGYS